MNEMRSFSSIFTLTMKTSRSLYF